MANNHLHRRKDAGTSYLTGGDGVPVVFLHGIPGSAFTWEAVASRLQRQFRVVLPDLRGFGRSDPPPGDGYMEGQARAVKELLNALDIEDPLLVTHDFGGPVGLTLMRLYPELRIKKLVLSDTNVFTDTYISPPLRLAKVPLIGTLFFHLLVGNRIGQWMLYQGAVTQKQTVSWRRFQRHLTPSGMAMTRRIFQRSLADLCTNYSDIEQMLPDIQIPTMVLWGDDDPFFSIDVAERVQEALPNAELTVYPQTGHFVPEERPTEVASILSDFLASR